MMRAAKAAIRVAGTGGAVALGSSTEKAVLRKVMTPAPPDEATTARSQARVRAFCATRDLDAVLSFLRQDVR